MKWKNASSSKWNASNQGKVDKSHTSQLEESHLRRRKPLSANEHSVEDLPPAEEERAEEEKEGVREGEPPKDPLKWFGILVPQSLRHSQQCFIQGKQTSYLK